MIKNQTKDLVEFYFFILIIELLAIISLLPIRVAIN